MDSYTFCAKILEDILFEAMDVSDEMELIFHKGHLSPLPSEPFGEANNSLTMASNDQQTDVFANGCNSHCIMKAMLFDKITEIELLPSEDDKVHEYLHTCADLLGAIEEIQKRLATLVD